MEAKSLRKQEKRKNVSYYDQLDQFYLFILIRSYWHLETYIDFSCLLIVLIEIKLEVKFYQEPAETIEYIFERSYEVPRFTQINIWIDIFLVNYFEYDH